MTIRADPTHRRAGGSDRSRAAADTYPDPRPEEQQRIDHLILGKPRPPARRVGKGRGKRRIPVQLAPAIEAALALREAWGHRQGTPETHDKAARLRDGTIARLYRSGAIDAEQLQAAADIAAIVERIAADVNVRTASLETRVDSQRAGDGAFFERLTMVRAEMAYTRWRRAISAAVPIAALLELIVADCGLVAVARRHRMSVSRLRAGLIAALDLWSDALEHAIRSVRREDLIEAHARLLG
jgi:hypothetical protein